jgi:hypothetical protein
MKFIAAICMTLAGLFFVLTATGQDNEVSVDATEATAPGTLKRCDLVFGESPMDLLVLDEQGNYLRRARYVTLSLQIGNRQPMVRVQSWDGAYKPSAAMIEKADWVVGSIRHVGADEFAAIVAGSEAAPASQPNVAPKKADPFAGKQ